MWYSTGTEYYWLGEEVPEGMPPLGVDIRPFAGNEVLIDQVRLGGLRYRWFRIGEETEKKFEGVFPTEPNAKKIAKMFADLGNPRTIILPDGVLVKDGSNGFILRLGQQNLLHWYTTATDTRVQLSVYREDGSPEKVASLKKYLGKNFEIKQDNFVWVKSKKSEDWLLIHNTLHFPDTGEIDPTAKAGCDTYLANTDYKIKMIDAYVNALSLEQVKNAAGKMNPLTDAIFTRCHGCTAQDVEHLKVHLARKELDLYLIHSAFDMFGKEVVGGPVRLVWDLVEQANAEDVKALDDLKAIMRSFFLKTILSGSNVMIVTPKQRVGFMGYWREGNWRQLRVVDDRIVENTRADEEPAGRVGELLNQERRQEFPPDLPPLPNPFGGVFNRFAARVNRDEIPMPPMPAQERAARLRWQAAIPQEAQAPILRNDFPRRRPLEWRIRPEGEPIAQQFQPDVVVPIALEVGGVPENPAEDPEVLQRQLDAIDRIIGAGRAALNEQEQEFPIWDDNEGDDDF